MIAPVPSMSNTAFEPCPSCQNSTISPSVAPSEIRLRITAFNGSNSDRNARASRMNVSTAISTSISGKLP